MRRIVAALVGIGVATALGAVAAERTERVLPGLQPGGSILLPNQWSLRPAGHQIEMGDFPVNIALHPSGQWAALLHAGYGDHEVIVVDLRRQRKVCRVLLDRAFYGLCFSPDGGRLFVSGAEDEVIHAFRFANGLLAERRDLRVASAQGKFIPAGLAIDGAGRTLYVAGPWGHAVRIVAFESAEAKPTAIATGPESYPYACLPDPSGQRLYVSLWNRAAIGVIDLAKREMVAAWPTEKHPTEMALAPGGKTLFVACANSTRVSVIDTASGRGLETIVCSLYPDAPAGNTPNSLCLTPDGQMLFVANADANNLAVVNVATPGKALPLGFIPVGWYPTSVRYNPTDRRLYVANGKGTTPLANPQGPQPGVANAKTMRQYIAGLLRGTLAVVDLPGPEALGRYSREAYACSPLRADQGVTAPRPRDNPVPAKVGEPSPIRHVIYVIKENRTYDQVLGDMKEGNGDRALCLFPERVTPNHHRLAREFVLLDNFYVDGEVSADGHQWSMGAYATDYVEKVWPLAYRGHGFKKLPYPSEGEGGALEVPAGGYLWDRCAQAGVSYRSYGEWVRNGTTPREPCRAAARALEDHFDPWFRSFDLDYPDQKRADRFLEELARFEREGDMPRLVILRLPNDHTAGARVGKPTPTAYVADNDLALGRVVEAVSRSRFWKDTALFVVEDDAQNGPDHVDAHRTVALLISPYTRGRGVDSSLYSTTSMVRTMELILGLAPMSQFDAAARPMYGSFLSRPDARPYAHLKPQANRAEQNQPTAWGAALSATLDLSREDAADDLQLNEIVWRSVRGASSAMPPPVRAAFVRPP